MKCKHHEEIQNFLWNRKGKPFLFSEMKKKIHGRTDFGGNRYKKWIIAKYNLKEFKKDGRVWLQKIPKKENSTNNEE